jgi:hypothetical protein
MKIEEENKSDLVIKPTKQNIDDALGVPEPFIDKCAVYVVSGSMGSGKSSFINSIMTADGKGRVFKNVFDKVFYSTPEEVFQSESNHPFKDHPPSRMFFDLSDKTFNSIIEQAIKEKEDGGNSCLILDDWGELLKIRRVELWLKRLIFKSRHYKLNIIISLLTLKLLPRGLRALIDVFIIFRPKSLIEVGNFGDEVFAMDKTDLRQLFDYVYDVPYNFLFYNQRSNKYYKNFNPLKIKSG